jgi:hypothetical protein
MHPCALDCRRAADQSQCLVVAASILGHDECDGGINDGTRLQSRPQMFRVGRAG